MLVEAYNVGGLWYFKDENNAEWAMSLSAGTKPLESKIRGDKLKTVMKLKKAGFTSDEIIDMFTGGVFK